MTKNPERLCGIAIAIVVAIGLYARMKGLNTWPLAVDEYYILKSIENIVQNGVPVFQTGGYYLRGVLYQYLVAPLIFLGLDAVFSLRLITVIANLIAIPAIYILGKKTSGSVVACLAVCFFSLSIWEIEFARFGRMYVPFQTVFLWYLVFLYKATIEHDSHSHRWLYVLSFTGILLWEGGLILFLLNFFPILLCPRRAMRTQLIFSSAFFILAYAYSKLNYSSPEVLNLPLDISAIEPLKLLQSGPLFLWSTFPENPFWLALFLVPLIWSMWSVYTLFHKRQFSFVTLLCISLIIVFSLANLFLLVLVSFLLLLLVGWVSPSVLRSGYLRGVLIAVGANFIFWLVYGLSTTSWHRFFPPFDPDLVIYKLLVVLFKYPNIFDRILFVWLKAIPMFTLLFSAAIAIGAVLCFTKEFSKDSKFFRLLIAIIVVLALVIGVKQTVYIETRYTFFLFPLFLILMPASLVMLTTKFNRYFFINPLIAAVFLSGTLFILSDEFSVNHILYIDTPAINFRTAYKDAKAHHYYFREDYKTPAEYINKRLEKNDIVITTVLPAEYYLEKIDFVYVNYQHTEFKSITREHGKTEKWTNAPLIYSEDTLFQTIDQAIATVWIINKAKERNVFEENIAARYGSMAVYQNLDSSYDVYMIKPNTEVVDFQEWKLNNLYRWRFDLVCLCSF
ncbi:MAG: hypothetical protein GXP18_05175 [Gammaproteobacteria bacterium]|nr:hypothetical protein [Gammaproteobacteria bacterium]